MANLFWTYHFGALLLKVEVKMEHKKNEEWQDMDMRGKFSLVHLYIVQFVKWALNHYICVYSLHNSSTSAFCQQRHIHIGISVQLPSVLLYPTSHI